jgi:hypothetical protein
MADQADVEAALVSAVGGALYPSGTSGSSAVGAVCRVYRGWPVATAIDADLAQGIINVSVFTVPDSLRNTTRWGVEVHAPATAVAPTLTVGVQDASATFGGSADPGQLAGLLIGGKAYVHRTGTGETPALVAAVLADAVRADRIALLTNATVTIPGVTGLIARTAADATVVEEMRRQRQQFRITAWCPDPDSRDAVARSVDAALAGVTFLPLADGSGGRIRFAGSTSFDQQQDAALYRRDLIYDVEYPTTLTSTLPSMLFGDVVLNAAVTLV